MDLGLHGLNAIVTGATRGIDVPSPTRLPTKERTWPSARVTPTTVVSAVTELQAKGVRATGRALDVGDGAALQEWVGDVADELGGIDIVVSNVSALAIGGDEDSWKSGFQIDLMGAVRLVDAAMPSLERSEAPAIVTISSVSGREIDFASSAYGTFKAALVHYTQGLAYHLAGKGIRANTVSPGNTYFAGGIWSQIETGDPGLFATALGLNPTGRMGTPQEMANAVAFIASPRASFITGANLVVDGALTKGVQL